MEIIDTDKLNTLLKSENIVIIDARGGADAYERYKTAHLKGALFADLETDLSEKPDNAANGGRHPLPEPEKFGKFLSVLGISSSAHVIVYDDKNGANAAARFWWMLKSAGHKKVQVVSGGLASLTKAGFEIVAGESPLTNDLSEYEFDEWNLPLVDSSHVSDVSHDDNYLVIDVRENYRYRGESEPIDLVAGHIPGAVNISFNTNLDENGEFLTTDKLKEKYISILYNRNPENIIVHCGSGVTACHTLLALEEAGISGASLYVGSWSEWSRNDLPVATGDNP